MGETEFGSIGCYLILSRFFQIEKFILQNADHSYTSLSGAARVSLCSCNAGSSNWAKLGRRETKFLNRGMPPDCTRAIVTPCYSAVPLQVVYVLHLGTSCTGTSSQPTSFWQASKPET